MSKQLAELLRKRFRPRFRSFSTPAPRPPSFSAFGAPGTAARGPLSPGPARARCQVGGPGPAFAAARPCSPAHLASEVLRQSKVTALLVMGTVLLSPCCRRGFRRHRSRVVRDMPVLGARPQRSNPGRVQRHSARAAQPTALSGQHAPECPLQPWAQTPRAGEVSPLLSLGTVFPPGNLSNGPLTCSPWPGVRIPSQPASTEASPPPPRPQRPQRQGAATPSGVNRRRPPTTPVNCQTNSCLTKRCLLSLPTQVSGNEVDTSRRKGCGPSGPPPSSFYTKLFRQEVAGGAEASRDPSPDYRE